jgi:hypothetical protein
MTIFGAFYTIKFRPRSGDINKAEAVREL